MQVKAESNNWYVSNYSCDRRNGKNIKFAIEISTEKGSFVVTEDGYYGNSKLYFGPLKSFYGIVKMKHSDKYVAIIDGKESDEYNSIGRLVFSSSGDRYGFVARRENGKYVAVIDGKESKEYDKIENKWGC